MRLLPSSSGGPPPLIVNLAVNLTFFTKFIFGGGGFQIISALASLQEVRVTRVSLTFQSLSQRKLNVRKMNLI